MNQKSNRYLLVINEDKEKADNHNEADLLKHYSDTLLNYNNFDFVATIIHDKDTLETGEIKRRHLHAFIELHEKATLKQLLGELTEVLNINTECLSLTPSNSPYLGVQYLTHKNDSNKYQYNFEDIKTNNQELLSQKYENQYIDPQQKLFEAITKSKTLTELTKEIGINDALKFRAFFNQIKQEQGAGIDAIISYHERTLKTIYSLQDTLAKLVKTLDKYFSDKPIIKSALGINKLLSEIEYDIEDLIF